jgi:hypothetical protein
MDGTTALAVLGLAPGASASQIKAAFRARAKLVHPDRHGGAEGFLALRQAYETATAHAASPDDRDAGPGRAPALGAAAERQLHLDRPAVLDTDRTAALPRRRPARWLADTTRSAPALDVLDITRPPAPRAAGRGQRTRSFDEHLALALAG